MNTYIGLAFATILPTLAAIVFIFLNKIKFVEKIPETVKQVIYGIVFGLIAVWGTENGIQTVGAVLNVRDGAVLTAGLVFGAPAGIIAGLIGGIERWFAVYWGVGAYTRVACSVSTALAGFYAAALRKRMFNDEKPSVFLALAIGIVMEVFHLSMVFLTNLSDVEHAMDVVKICSLPMITANGIATMISVFVTKLLNKEYKEESDTKTISDKIQAGLLISVVIIFLATTAFSYRMQSQITDEQVKSQLTQAIDDLTADVEDASGTNLLAVTKEISKRIKTDDLKELCAEFGVAEINVINQQGIITSSSNDDFVGYDMYSGEQSIAFMNEITQAGEYVQKYGPIGYDSTIYRKYAGMVVYPNYIQVGYDAEEFQDEIAAQVRSAAKNKHVGKTGYLIIAGQDYGIVSAPINHKHNTLQDYGFDLSVKANVLNEGIVDDEEVKFVYSEAEGYYIVSVLPIEEGYKVRSVATYVNVFMQIMAFAVLFVMVYSLIKKVVVSSMNRTNTSLAKIIDGDLDEVVEVNETSEFAELSNDINLTVDKLKDFIAEANARIDAEIQYAKNIQESALPHVFPNNNKYEIFALMEAAKGVGGDFYDFFNTTRHGVNFLIADVSGKGIPGAMFMMRAKSELHSLTETGIEVHDVFTYGNERLCEGNDAGMFVTAWQGCINTSTGLVKYANAGHNPPVIIRTDGTVEFVRGKAGFVLAGMEGMVYKDQELQMYPGDILFLYTDGVVEATNAEKELYGDDRLIECLKRADKTLGMDYLCCEVIGDVGMFVGEAEQFDDITMLAFKFKGEEGESLKPKAYVLDGSSTTPTRD